MIVYCLGQSGGVCMAGVPIVPRYSQQFDKNGHYIEYVEIARANKKFIVVRTLELKSKNKNYWIISKDFKLENCTSNNCDSIITSHLIGPLEYSVFQKKLSQLKINLSLDKN
jgi:hypothetical protein